MRLDSQPRPIADYAEAIARIAQLQARDDETINPLCRTLLHTHGEKVERALVFLHGFTNCPQQFHILAQNFFEQGCNVLVPRLPYHGLRNRLSDDIARLSAAELARFTDEAIDLAHGLGDQVSVLGLSLGGNLALWAAMQRADIDRAVVIAPLLLPRHVPERLLPLVVRVGEFAPNLFIWWDSRYKEKLPGPQYAYSRFSTHGLAAVFALARDVQQRTFEDNALPRARSIVVVTNANDPALDNRPLLAIVKRWRANGAANVETYEFDASLNLIHDIVDPQQAEQHTDIVYGILIASINGTQTRFAKRS